MYDFPQLNKEVMVSVSNYYNGQGSYNYKGIGTKRVQMDCEAGWEMCGFVK